MLEIKDVKKKFVRYTKNKKKEEFYADKGISLTAKEGSIIGVLGPNGAGKTTLLRMIGGILEPTSGSITIDNLTYDKNEIEIKKKIAYLSGNTKIYQSISGYELLKMCGDLYGVPKDEIENRIKAISKELELDSFLHNRIGNLSTGQTQRINIARCLVHEPKYYILDEATSGLDIISSQVILDFIKKEKEKGKVVLYSTHYMEEAEHLSDRIGIMANGNLVAVGTAEELIQKAHAKNFEDAFVQIATGGELA